MTFWDLGVSLYQHLISESGSFFSALVFTVQLNLLCLLLIKAELTTNCRTDFGEKLISSCMWFCEVCCYSEACPCCQEINMCKVYTFLKSRLDINLKAISEGSGTMTPAQKILTCKLDKGCESVQFMVGLIFIVPS